jgi:hypothetical protein
MPGRGSIEEEEEEDEAWSQYRWWGAHQLWPNLYHPWQPCWGGGLNKKKKSLWRQF